MHYKLCIALVPPIGKIIATPAKLEDVVVLCRNSGGKGTSVVDGQIIERAGNRPSVYGVASFIVITYYITMQVICQFLFLDVLRLTI